MPERGKYIVFEGGEHVGKTTQVERLATKVGGVAVREPGGTLAGFALREVLLDPKTALTVDVEVLLMAADRAVLAASIVRPSLASGLHVVSDRSWFSSMAYQGLRGASHQQIMDTNQTALGELMRPDLVILLDAAPEQLAGRGPNSGDRFESLEGDFHRQLRERFLRMAEEHDFKVVDAARPIDEVSREIDDIIGQTIRVR